MHIFLKIKSVLEGVNFKLTSINLHSVFVLIMLNHQSLSVVTVICINHAVCTQDIRRFFQPTSGKPSVQRTAPSGGTKTEEKKKNHHSPDEEVKRKKKETAKARESSSVLLIAIIPLFQHFIH